MPNTQIPQQSDTASKDGTKASAVKQHPDTQETNSTDDENEDEPEEVDSSMPDSEPQDQIEAFDWDELQQCYHDKTHELDQQEQAVMNQFNSLCDERVPVLIYLRSANILQYFSVWAQTGSMHETGRSFKRCVLQFAHTTIQS